MSLKEVEKERKLALDVHAAIHRLNDKFQPVLQSISLFREPSLYQGADDQDGKVTHVEQLEKNLDAILSLLSRYQSERVQCFRLIGVQYNEQMQLTELLHGNINVSNSKANVQDIEKTARETEQRLMKEITLLHDTLELHETRMKDVGEKHRSQLETLEVTNKELKTKLLIKSAITSSSKACQTSRGKVRHASVQVSTIEVRKPQKEVRHRGIQTKLKDKSVTFDVEKRPGTQSTVKDVDQHSPITSVTIVNTPLSHTFQSPTDILASFDILHRDFMARSKEEMLGHVTDSSADRTSRNRFLQQQSGQLNDHPFKMDGSDGYKHQLALLRASRKRSEFVDTDGKMPLTDRSDHSREGSVCRKKWPPSESGYLSGKKLNDDDVIHRKTATTSTSKCLRCNRTYKVKSNHRKACRYHPKPKKTVEKYDSGGKLVKMVHVWGCCNGKPDSIGCEVGQHV